MEVCRQYAIPHSVFLGQWTQEDRDKAVALERYRRERCPRCGSMPEDWKGDDGYPLEEPRWMAEILRCLGCEQVENAQSAISQRSKGAYVALVPFDPDVDDQMDFQ